MKGMLIFQSLQMTVTSEFFSMTSAFIQENKEPVVARGHTVGPMREKYSKVNFSFKRHFWWFSVLLEWKNKALLEFFAFFFFLRLYKGV